MIIECQACQTRFRLDESKITGKGARIRCRRCGESIIVMKSDIPPPVVSPPAGNEFFDLRAVLEAPEKKTPVPPRNEVDTAFKSILDQDREAGRIPPPAVDETASPTAPEQEASTQEPVEPPAAPEPPPGDISIALDTPPSEEQERETFAQEPADTLLSRDEVDTAMENPLFSVGESEPPVTEEPASPTALEQEASTQEPVEPPDAPEPVPRDDIETAFDTLLYEDRERETLAQEPADTPPPQDEADTAMESPLFSEGESEPAVTEEPAPPPVDKEILDLRAILGEPEEKTADPLRDETDTAMESPLFSEGESEPPAAEEPSAPAGFPDTPFPLELEKEEEISFLPVPGEIPVQGLQELTDQAPKVPTSPMERGREQIHESEEFLRIDTVLPDFLRKEGAATESSGQFDISEHLTIDPVGTPEEDKAPVPPTPDLPPLSEETPSSRADAMHEEMTDLAESSPVEETSVPESPSQAVPPPIPLEIGKMQATHPRPPVPSGKPSVALLLVLFVTLAGGGAYLAFTKTGQETLRTLIPGMESLWLGGKESVRPYHVGNLIGYYEMSEKAGKMFIIKGVATNQGRSKKSGIRIRAELLDSNHQTIAEKTVYAGNIVAGLRLADQEKIEAAMSNRFGDRLSNLDVEPGKSVPFMVAFFTPPEGIEEYRLEALDGD